MVDPADPLPDDDREDREDGDAARGFVEPTPGLNLLDLEREASMADEGGISAAWIETERAVSDAVSDAAVRTAERARSDATPHVSPRAWPRVSPRVQRVVLALGALALLGVTARVVRRLSGASSRSARTSRRS